MKKKKILSLLGAAIISAILYLLMFQERFIFFPTQVPKDYRYPFPTGQERDFEFEGKLVNSLLFQERASKYLILYFHGNAGSLDTWGQVGEEVRSRLKESIWIVDYPGYGKSEGSIRSEKQLLEFALKFFEVAKAEFPEKKIIVYGRSIGSGPAAWLAKQRQLPLILESPFESFSKLASELAPWFPSLLRRYSFEVLDWLENFNMPVLLVHGERDEVIPVRHSKQISSKLRQVTLQIIPEAMHNNLSDYPQYWSSFRDYLIALKANEHFE